MGTNVDLSVNDFDGIAKFCVENKIDTVVVGPEDPLVNGLHDHLASLPELSNTYVIGPKKEAAQLEGSKDYAKEFMMRHDIPTAQYQTFTADTLAEGQAFLETLSALCEHEAKLDAQKTCALNLADQRWSRMVPIITN